LTKNFFSSEGLHSSNQAREGMPFFDSSQVAEQIDLLDDHQIKETLLLAIVKLSDVGKKFNAFS